MKKNLIWRVGQRCSGRVSSTEIPPCLRRSELQSVGERREGNVYAVISGHTCKPPRVDSPARRTARYDASRVPPPQNLLAVASCGSIPVIMAPGRGGRGHLFSTLNATDKLSSSNDDDCWGCKVPFGNLQLSKHNHRYSLYCQ